MLYYEGTADVVMSWNRKCTSGHLRVQWRRQDLLRGGTKMEIMSRGTDGGLQGRVQQLLDDNFVTNAVLIERAVSC